VKVRGVRIEPGEIEAVLAAHPVVREGAVGLVGGTGGAGGERLVAYVVAGAPGPELRRYLEARLPEAMVPAAFVLLPALPLTPNGKVDRRALAGIEPEAGRSGGAGGTPPRTATEVLLAGIWSRVLGIEGVTVDDDFFALGGHSLLATQVTSRVREIFGIELPLRLLFEAPTLTALAREIDGRRIHGGGMPRLPAPPLRPYARTGSSALSFAQERLWFLDQLTPGAATYNVPVALRLRGELSPAAFAGSLGEVVRRQEALRTTFFATGGQPLQRISPAFSVEIPQVDLTPLPSTVRDDEGLRLARVEGCRPFDLSRGPLLRATLVRLAPAEHLALLSVHHIVADGWSMGVLVREMGALYGAFLAGPSAPSPALPELPVQYADFALWQREWLSGEVLEAEIAYWRRAVAGIPRTLDLPTDRPRPTAPTYRGRHLAVALPPPLARTVGVFSRESGSTPFMVFLAGFEALLYRWSGQEDFLVGTAVANRTLQELEGLIGFFVNTLALPAGLAGEPGFGALVGQVRDIALAAYAHQDLPLEKLVEAVEPRRDLSRTPLFQVLFALQNTPAEPLELPRLRIEPIEVEWGTAKFDLTLSLEETPEGLGGYLEYATDLFDGTTALRLLGHFGNLLADALAHPERPVSRLALLGEAERQQLLGEWSGGPTPYPRQSTIHGLFAAQSARRPDAVAVAADAAASGGCLSYGELDRRAGRFAHRLRALGVQAESRVGLLLERSPERVVATLAILRAGGCYLPLDPAYPRDRLALLLADAGPAVVVTESGLLPLLPELSVPAPQILRIDREIPASGADALDSACEEIPAESLAYVMYTSGSTGIPKGVAVPHRGVVRLVCATAYAEFSPREVFLQLAPYAFDASTFEVWGALLHGARLVLPPPGALSLQELGDLLARHGVTTLWLTAGLFHQMVEENLAGLAGVRQLLAGGDVLSVPHVRRVVDELPGTRLLNGYGPTEGTTFTCCFAATSALDASVPLGRPIANTWIQVVDRELAPVPIGVPGELWVGGDGLARGYLDRPGATAERFVPDPFRRGERLYRTGDLARFRPDGRLEFLRRIDSQVKVRGFRIEPGEVEAALLGYPGVLRAVVVAREGGPGGKCLVAYLVGAPDEVLSPAELRGYLRERLPEPLVPGIFVVLPELPLSVHGKVDRRALPAPPIGEPGEAERASFAPPSGPIEEGLAGIWADLLEVEPPGREDNFFELGGHSLLATRVVSRVREALGVDLPLRLLFAAPTLSALAREIEALRFARESVAGVTVSTIRRADRERWSGGLPLSFAQERLWFLDQLDPGSPAYNVPGVLRLAGRLDVAALRAAFREVVRRQEALRTTFAETGGQPVQAIAPASDLPIPLADLAGLREAVRTGEARRLAGFEAGRGFELTRGPLLRGALLRLAPEEHWILLTMHHIVSDGWSVGVLVREVGALYASPAVLPELPIQYADFAVWQRDWLSGDVLASQLAFWRQALAGSPTLDLPTDRPRPPVLTSRGGFVRFALGARLARQLAAFSRAEGSTLFMTLLTAFAGLLSRYSGQSDVAVGSPLANRTRSEIEGLIGFFVNTLVLRADLSGDPSFRQALARVRQRSLAAFSHQDLPFEKVVEELAPQRDPSRTPLFQVMFVLQNAPMGELVLPGLRFEPVEMAGERAKFDLTLSCRETAAGLALGIEYNRDLFEETTARRLASHLTILLEAVAAAPDTRLADLPLLTAPERAQLLREWSRGTGDSSDPGLLHDLISERAALQPDAVALVSDIGKEGHLSHAELDRRSQRLAARLAELGVGPESIVGIYAERSPEMVIGLLGILQAGAAYLPLDPSLPDERLAWMLDDGKTPLILTHGDLSLPPALLRGGRSEVRVNGRSGRQGLARTERNCLSPRAEFEHRPQPDPAVPLRPDPGNPAYVIYTSGSTGLPKGVMISHQAITERLRYSTRDEVLPGERIVQKATIGFDVSVFEIFGTLAAGGRLILAKPGGQQDADYLLDLLTRHEATYVSFPPVLLSALLEREGFRALASLRDVLTGGESVPADLPGRFHAAMPCDLLNRYGPTETTISVTSWRFPRDGGERPVPIGRPIAAAEIYLLDRDLHPVPVGVVGELYVGGVHLARGYLGSPELTAERFVPDPVGAALGLRAGGRLYRSGDLARYQADGAIEFAGRVDHQVKIRGFRVELGEIEAALATHEEVREAVVADRADPLGSRRLVAYVIPAGAAGPALVPVLRAHLEARLPSYMVPAAFVLLAAFPLSPSGKVDRRTLPEPAPEGAPYLAPRTPAEEVVAGLFADLLKQDRVGARDDFFALGGHSLLATRLASRLRQAFDVELPLRRLFERPTVAGLAAAVEEIRAEGASPAPPLLPARLDGPVPLSFAQERLWFLDQLDPGSAAYHMPGAFRLRGALDVPALRASLGEIVHRHAALRTVFATPEGRPPVQVLAARTDLAFPLADVAGLPAGAREEEGRRLAAEEAVRPFDLGRGPLFRAGLVRLGPHEHLALVTMHHIVSDGWSMGVLVAELGALYPAFVARLPSALAALPALPIQYADFAVWQRGWLSGETLESQIAYWRQSLAALPPLELPTDRPRPARRRGRGAVRSFRLSEELRQSLARFSREEGATLFMTLLAGLSALLSRLTGQDDLAVGSPIAGRTRAEVEGLIGFFVNTLVLRADLVGAPGFRALVARTRERTLAAFSHQDLPFEKVVEAVAPERDTSRTPLFQVLFVLQNVPAGRLELPGLTLEPLALAWEAAKFDLTLTLSETVEAGSGLAGSWEYDRDLFDAPTVLRLAGHFERLLAGMVARPDLAISEAPILGEPEREQVRAQWNDLPRLQRLQILAKAGGSCLHERVARQAERRPEAVALVWNEERLTYGALLARVHRLARRLRDLGVGPEVRVGICARRTPDLVTALLGVLAAGGAYVPLDPEYPRERLSFMLADSGASLVIAGGDVADRLPAGEVRILDLGEMLATGPPPLGETGAVPGNLAYLIYTSGSTGRPKGVAIEHRSAIALVDWATRAFTAEELEGVLAATSVCFDLSVFEVFVPLALGGRVVLAANALALPDLPGAWEVSLVNTVPAAMRELVRGGRLPGSVRTVNLAGEPLPRALAEAVHAAGVARLLNLYGPSEDTTYSTIEEVAAGEPGEPRIGRPLPGSQAYGVDRAGQLAPMGVAAELQLGGAGLARGYLGRPELTAERFVPDALSGEPGARLYRTGDLVRSRPDGRWGFLGRIDHQVKVRGFRIELGEIEAALLAAPGVREAVVLARRDTPGAPETPEDVRLVAYVVGLEEGDLDGPLRLLLAERLPEPMIPAAFVGLSALPRTPNGKLDRKALPAPEWKAGTDYLAPRTAVEEVLAGLFAEILGVSRVGVEDSFFRLGGHSLLATQLVSRVQGTFRVKLPLRRLFETPTVMALASAVLAGEAKAGQSEKIARALLRLRGTKP
jgi:amino acid adenylation domain-containing protein